MTAGGQANGRAGGTGEPANRRTNCAWFPGEFYSHQGGCFQGCFQPRTTRRCLSRGRAVTRFPHSRKQLARRAYHIFAIRAALLPRLISIGTSYTFLIKMLNASVAASPNVLCTLSFGWSFRYWLKIKRDQRRQTETRANVPRERSRFNLFCGFASPVFLIKIRRTPR